MNQPLEIKNINEESTVSILRSRLQMQKKKVKQESDSLVQSVVYIKTELYLDDNELPVTASTSNGMEPKYDIKIEPMIKIEREDYVMQGPLDVSNQIKVEDHYSSKSEGEKQNQTERNDKEELDPLKNEDSNESESNSQKQLKKDRPTRRDHYCHICNKIVKCHLDRHLITHSDQKPFMCDVCNTSFKQRGSLNTHMLIHTGEKPHVCELCNKVFRHSSALNKHILIHKNIRPYQCSECNKSFTHKYYLVVHNRRHTNEKPYACDLCEKTFYQRNDLTKHKLSHTDEKLFSCDKCDKSFKRRARFNLHYKKYHTN